MKYLLKSLLVLMIALSMVFSLCSCDPSFSGDRDEQQETDATALGDQVDQDVEDDDDETGITFSGSEDLGWPESLEGIIPEPDDIVVVWVEDDDACWEGMDEQFARQYVEDLKEAGFVEDARLSEYEDGSQFEYTASKGDAQLIFTWRDAGFGNISYSPNYHG